PIRRCRARLGSRRPRRSGDDRWRGDLEEDGRRHCLAWLVRYNGRESWTTSLDTPVEGSLASLGIQEWKRTSSQYVAILQAMDRFEPNSIRQLEKKNGETVLGGILRGSDETDWYA